MVGLAIVLSLIAGLCKATQSPTNAALSKDVGNAQATLISFTGGTILLLVLSLLFGSGDLSRIAEAPAWQLLGGVYGVILVFTITYATPVLGVALTLTIVMFGQLAMGVIIDSFGLLGVQQLDISPLRVLGVLIVALGIVCIYRDQMKVHSSNAAFDKSPKQKHASSKVGILFIMTCLAGIGSAAQAATNSALAVSVGTIEASFISFVTGMLVILVFTLIKTKGNFRPITHSAPWKFLGGAYGAATVYFVVLATPYLGVGLLMAVMMLGQLVGAAVVDSRGWFQAKRLPIDAWRLAGMIIIALGVVVVTYAKLC